MPRQLLICAGEKEYAKRLAEYIAGQKEFRFRVHYCADPMTGRQLAESLKPDYLLMDDSFTREERDRLSGRKRFVLTEDTHTDLKEGEIAIFKYSSGREILSAVTENSLDDAGLSFHKHGRENVKIIGFYSPVKRVGQTTLVLAIGSRLASDDSTVYLNLCAYSIGGHFPENDSATLDQYLYFLDQDTPNGGLRLKSMASQRGELDYLRPVPLRDDLEAIEEHTWIRMIQMLKREAPYGYVLLDLGESVRGYRDLLKQCSIIYMPVSDDEFAAAKIASFSRELKAVGDSELIRKIRKVTMNRDISILADSCVRAIQAEGEAGEPTRRDQRAGDSAH